MAAIVANGLDMRACGPPLILPFFNEKRIPIARATGRVIRRAAAHDPVDFGGRSRWPTIRRMRARDFNAVARAAIDWERPIVPAATKNFCENIAPLIQTLMLNTSPDRFDHRSGSACRLDLIPLGA
jgi:hypothetical protein